VTGNEREQAMTQVDPAETGQGDGRRDTGSGTWRAGIRRAIRIGSRPGPWKRGLVLATLALLLGLLMLLHAKIPNRIGNLGSLVETCLPWFGLFIPVLLVGSLLRRSASAVAALLLPVVVWLNLFGGLISATLLDAVLTPILFLKFGERPLLHIRELAAAGQGSEAY